jgi:hypothetical protein
MGAHGRRAWTPRALALTAAMVALPGTLPAQPGSATYQHSQSFGLTTGSVTSDFAIRWGWELAALARSPGTPDRSGSNGGVLDVPAGTGFLSRGVSAGPPSPLASAFGEVGASLGYPDANAFPSGQTFTHGTTPLGGTVEVNAVESDARLGTRSEVVVQGGLGLTGALAWAPAVNLTTQGSSSATFSDRLTASVGGGPTVDLLSVSGSLYGPGTLTFGSGSLMLNALNPESYGVFMVAVNGGYTASGGFVGGALELVYGDGRIVGVSGTGLFAALVAGDPDLPNPLALGAPANFTVAVPTLVSAYNVTGLGAGDVRFTFDSRTLAAAGTAVVPEPGTLLLLGTGLVGVAGIAVRRRRAGPSAGATGQP